VGPATTVVATSLRVRTGGPSIADLTPGASTWALALLMATLTILATSTVPAMPTIQVILTDPPLGRRPALTAHTIGMVLGPLIPTAIPTNSNIRHRRRTNQQQYPPPQRNYDRNQQQYPQPQQNYDPNQPELYNR
jgi:hypothetical protein